MTTYYVDTSALVKRYVNEVGSDWLRAMLNTAGGPRQNWHENVLQEVTLAVEELLDNIRQHAQVGHNDLSFVSHSISDGGASRCSELHLTVFDSGAGMPDGEYELGGQKVVVKDGAVRLPDGTLAGSCLTLDAAVRNVREFTGRPLAECLQMATLTPARSIGVADRKGSLEPGKDADIVLLTPQLNVAKTIVGGNVVYSA